MFNNVRHDDEERDYFETGPAGELFKLRSPSPVVTPSPLMIVTNIKGALGSNACGKGLGAGPARKR